VNNLGFNGMRQIAKNKELLKLKNLDYNSSQPNLRTRIVAAKSAQIVHCAYYPSSEGGWGGT
jgi:hypothetical protein